MFFYSLLKSGAGISEIIVCAVSVILSSMIAIILHEVAHGFVALKCGDFTAKSRGRLTLNPVAHFDLIGLLLMLLVGFGWAKPVPIDPRNFKNYKRDMIFVSIAGVVTNLLMAGFFLLLLYLLYPVIGYYKVTEAGIVVFLKYFAFYFLYSSISVNFMLAFFNILPIYPLDGYRVLNMFLKPNSKYRVFMMRYGVYTLFGLILVCRVLSWVGLEQLNVFEQVSSLISRLIQLVAR